MSSSSCPRGRGGVPDGLPYRLVSGERCVPRHEEVQPGGGDQRSNQPDEVIVHVSGIPERGGAGRHDGGDLGERTGSASTSPHGHRAHSKPASHSRAGGSWSACGGCPWEGWRTLVHGSRLPSTVPSPWSRFRPNRTQQGSPMPASPERRALLTSWLI